jgi:outer membrane receptor protein involved in Fe transport
MKSRFYPSTAALLALSLLPSTGASAQTEARVADGDQRLGDIVVTAQRRDESALDVPIALSVLSGDELARRGVSNVNDLQFQTPSLEVVPAFGGGQPQFRIRGVGFEDYATNNTPTVGIYVDEIAYPVPVMTQGALFDIERVEVLHGPQGTLYGRNTTGGAINFITRRPTEQFSAGVDAEYGRFGLLKAEGFVSGPISETLRFRVAGVTEQGGGFQRNRNTGEKLGDADRLFGRALLDWTPSGSATIQLNIHGGRDRSEQTGLYLFRPFQTRGYGGPLGPVIPADTNRRQTGWGLSPTFAALAGYDVDDKPHRDNDSWGASLTGKFDLSDAVRFTSISSYEKFKRRELADWDASASRESDTFWGSDVEVYSQELRLSSNGDRPLNWVVGGYYSNQTLDELFLTDFSESLGFITDTSYRQKAESISGFGQASLALGERFAIVGGIRYEHEKRKLRDFATKIGGTPLFLDGNRNATLDEASAKLALEFRPRDGLLFYASASRGVKSGGFTVYNSPNANQIDAFKPEILYAYEAGFKADFARAVRFQGSVFYYDYRNQQVLGTIVNPQRGLIGRIINAPKSEIYGGELEIQIAPTSSVRISQSVGYKYGRYKDFSDIDTTTLRLVNGLYVADTIDKSGQPIPIAQWSYQGSISYALPLGKDFGLDLQGDYSFRDELPSFLGPTYDLDERWIANATVTLRPANGNWWVGAYARNLFGTKYDLTRNFFLPNANIASPGRPASYGVRLGFSF